MKDLFAAAVKRAQSLATGYESGDVSLHYFEDDYFLAEAVNPCACVNIGESGGKFRGRGETAEQALTALLDAMK